MIFINNKAKLPRLTGLLMYAALRAARVQSARSWLRHSHASFTHIASPRNASHCFIGGWQRH